MRLNLINRSAKIRVMKVGIVLCYGQFRPERTDYVSYKQYLDFIAGEIGKRGLERAILCGGFTVPEHPEDSEASTCQKYLLLIKPDFTNYFLEDRSITTNQNLEFAAKELKPEDEIVVFGDLIRLAKIIWIAMHFLLHASQDEIFKAVFEFASAKDLHKELPGEFRYRNLTVVGFDWPGRTREETIRQIFATLSDVLSLYDEKKNHMELKQRKRDFRLR